MKNSNLRKLIKEYLMTELLVEFESKDMAKGTTWKVGAHGWAAKNQNGVTDYWYSDDEAKNKELASNFSHDTSRKRTQ